MFCLPFGAGAPVLDSALCCVLGSRWEERELLRETKWFLKKLEDASLGEESSWQRRSSNLWETGAPDG